MDRRNWIKTNTLAGVGLIASTQIINSMVINENETIFSPDWETNPVPLKHSWSGLGNIDQMRWIIRKDMQDQLSMAYKELGLRHVRAVGIFDDELRVIGRDPSRFFLKEGRLTPRINWRIPNYIFDSLLEIGINPMVTTCFMPKALASGLETTFETKSNITPPKNISEWTELLDSFMSNLERRYGRNRMKDWYFEVWNEPNLYGFWTGGMEGYYQLYKTTTNTIKKYSSDYRIGGPSTARAEFIKEFIEFGKANNCSPDYIIGHCYNNDSASSPLSPFEGPKEDLENKSPNFTSGVVRGVKKLLNELDYKGEIHWNEWGLSWHPYAPVRETPNEAAFIVKTMNEVCHLGDYFAYWCLSDIYDQVGYNKEAFSGHYGMINQDGLKKPNYFAHELLGKLGTHKTPVKILGEPNPLLGAFCTLNEDSVKILLYSFNIDYKVEDPIKKQSVSIILPNDIDVSSQVVYRLNSTENNIPRQWIEMGKPDYPSMDQVLELKKHNQIKTSDQKMIVQNNSNNSYIAKTFMETPEVIFIEFKLNNKRKFHA